MTWTSSGVSPSRVGDALAVDENALRGIVQRQFVRPSHTAMVACGSIGLCVSKGVRIHVRFSRRPVLVRQATSPRLVSGGSPRRRPLTARRGGQIPGSAMALPRIIHFDGWAASSASSNVSATTTAIG